MAFSPSDVVDPPPSAEDQYERERRDERGERREERKERGKDLWEEGRKSDVKKKRRLIEDAIGRSTWDRLTRAGTKRAHEQKTQRQRRLIMREGTKACEGKERNVS